MNDFPVYQQLRALNNMAEWKYLSTGAHTFTASSTGAAYRIVPLRNSNFKSMTNTWCLNSSVLTSADTISAGCEITGKITAITVVKGRAAANIAKEELFIS